MNGAAISLRELLFLIFKDPLLAPGHALHFLRAYHLVDVSGRQPRRT